MEGVTLSAAQNVVQSWVKGSKGLKVADPKTSVKKSDSAPTLRASRLGVGAKPTQQHHISAVLERKLTKVAQGNGEEKAKRKRPDKRPEVESEDEEGKTAVFKSKKRLATADPKLSKKERQKRRKEGEQPKVEKSNLTDGGEDVGEDLPEAESSNIRSSLPASTSAQPLPTQHTTPESAWGAKKPDEKKRRKTRSRQKNIRKDTRPADQKPDYLTPGSAAYQPSRREFHWKKGGRKNHEAPHEETA